MAAALRPMLAVAREEVAILAETAVPRAAAETSGTVASAGAHEAANPLVVRQAVQTHVVRESVARPHLPTELDALANLRGSPVSSVPTLTAPGAPGAPSAVVRALEEGHATLARTLDETASIRDTLSNAGQTGLGDAAQQIAEAAQALLEGRGAGKEAQAGVGLGARAVGA